MLVDATIDLLYKEADGTVLVLYDVSANPPTSGPIAHSDLVARAFEAATGEVVAKVKIIAVNRDSAVLAVVQSS
jgi:hypothetical protein